MACASERGPAVVYDVDLDAVLAFRFGFRLPTISDLDHNERDELDGGSGSGGETAHARGAVR